MAWGYSADGELGLGALIRTSPQVSFPAGEAIAPGQLVEIRNVDSLDLVFVAQPGSLRPVVGVARTRGVVTAPADPLDVAWPANVVDSGMLAVLGLAWSSNVSIGANGEFIVAYAAAILAGTWLECAPDGKVRGWDDSSPSHVIGYCTQTSNSDTVGRAYIAPI